MPEIGIDRLQLEYRGSILSRSSRIRRPFWVPPGARLIRRNSSCRKGSETANSAVKVLKLRLARYFSASR